jgi:hypothetical protein
LRISEAFKRKLIAEAANEKRSVTNYLEVVLEGYRQERLAASSPIQQRGTLNDQSQVIV